jgi:hypothetical protein
MAYRCCLRGDTGAVDMIEDDLAKDEIVALTLRVTFNMDHIKLDGADIGRRQFKDVSSRRPNSHPASRLA